VLQPGFVGLGTTFAVAEVLQPGFVGLGTTFAVAEVLQPGFVVFLGFEGHDISPVEMFYEDYTTNFFGNIVALFMDRYSKTDKGKSALALHKGEIGPPGNGWSWSCSAGQPNTGFSHPSEGCCLTASRFACMIIYA